MESRPDTHESGATPAADDRPPAAGADEAQARAGTDERPEAGSAGDATAGGADGAAEPVPSAEGGEPDPAAEEPDYRDLYLRSAAELDNVRKRARQQVGAAEAKGVGRLARELLPALDNLERAIAAVEAEDTPGDASVTQGVRLVQQELVGALERVGIVPDTPKGEQFDPHRHEAVAQAPVEGAESGTIVEVYQAGYRHGDEILRAAKVVVAQ